jgi:hypothetical protein
VPPNQQGRTPEEVTSLVWWLPRTRIHVYSSMEMFFHNEKQVYMIIIYT